MVDEGQAPRSSTIKGRGADRGTSASGDDMSTAPNTFPADSVDGVVTRCGQHPGSGAVHYAAVEA